MLYLCKKFDSDLSHWDASRIQESHGAFRGCDSLKKIPDWYKK